MNENLMLLIFGIFFILIFFNIAVILENILELFCPNCADKLINWLNIPTEEWEE